MACVFGSPYALNLIARRRSNGVPFLRKFFVRLTVLPLQCSEITHPVFEISITLRTRLPNGFHHGWMDQDGTWHGDRPQPSRLCVRLGPSRSPKRGWSPPSQWAHAYCGQTAGCIKMPLGTDVGLSPGDFVFDGNPAPPSLKRGRSPQFSAHVYCGQMAAWIKMPLGTEVGLGPDDIVLDEDPAPSPPKRGRSPLPKF